MNRSRARYFLGVTLAVVAAAALRPISAHPQTAISPPVFAPCHPATPPALPMRWRAVGLMSPFTIGQIDVGEFVYDGNIPALRATLYGLESGAVDLLITGTDTYLLSGPYRAPTGCTSLGRRFAPPAQWLSPGAVCIGEAPLATTDVQWWSMPGVKDQAIRHWFRKQTRLPWRSVFLTPSPNPAVIGDYAMTYFPTFAPLSKTNIARLRDFCAAHAKKSNAAAANATTARALMAIRNEAAEAERLQRIGTLIPGLSHAACSGVAPVPWPNQFVMTAIFTPQSFRRRPYSTIMYYDWNGTGSQVAGNYQGTPPLLQNIVMLKKRVGFWLRRDKSAGVKCLAVYPGIVRPDWMTSAFCKCRGVIARNPDLNPDGVIRIFACPIKWQLGHVMWSWYTPKGHPVVFIEAAASKAGIMLADYYRWLPGQTPPATFFDLPKECVATNGANPIDPSCSDCHTTPW